MSDARPAPLVTAIVPNYNHARHLPGRVASVLNQTLGDAVEVLLMDDCSTDDSRAVLERYADHPRVRLLFNETNSGSTFKQWNRGVAHARGRYVWFAESDDLAEPTLLEKVVGLLEQHPDCTMGCCESWLLHGDGLPAEDRSNLEAHYRPPPRTEFWKGDFVSDGASICRDDLIFNNPIPNASAAVMRRDAYEDVGGADESMRQAGDRLMYAKLLSRGGLAHVGERLNYYRMHDNTVRSKTTSTGPTIVEVYRVLRFIRDEVGVEAVRFDAALRQTAAYFAKAAARRGVGPRDLALACGAVKDVDPKIYRRLLGGYVAHRTLGPSVRLARRLRRGRSAA